MIYDADALHGFAHDSIAEGSKSFARASRLFDRQTREHVWLLYAWCRAADDLVDGQDHGWAKRHGGGGKHDEKAASARIDAIPDQAKASDPTGQTASDTPGLPAPQIATPPARSAKTR